MGDLIRDTALGYIIRSLSRNRLLQHHEDRSDFQIPDSYLRPFSSPHTHSEAGGLKNKSETQLPNIDSALEDSAPPSGPVSRKSIDGGLANSIDIEKSELCDTEPVTRVNSRVDLEKITSRADLDRAISIATLKRGPTRPISPERTSDGVILVDWYTTDDPANPQNWSFGRKNFVSLQICLYTFAVYLGSAIYTPSEPYVIEVFGVSATAASLGLALYVLGCKLIEPNMISERASADNDRRYWSITVLAFERDPCYRAKPTVHHHIRYLCYSVCPYSISRQFCWPTGSEIFARLLWESLSSYWGC